MNFIRQSHAVTDLNTRIPKAQKIEIPLDLAHKTYEEPLRLLEVGCGSGGRAHYFATHSSIKCEVHAVDIYDNRHIYNSFSFTKVTDTLLPFKNNSFDIVNLENISMLALRTLFELEKPDSIVNDIIKRIPDNFLKAFNSVNPTLVYKLEAKK